MFKVNLKSTLKTLGILCVLMILGGIGLYLLLSSSGDFYEGVKSFNEVTDKLIFARLLLFIFIYFNWRFFVSAMRSAFGLKNRATIVLFKCKKVFLYMVGLDLFLMLLSLV